MANKYLAREDTPFGSKIWEVLDATLKQAAESQLVGRRLLDVEGPYGLGLKSVSLGDAETESGLITSQVLPVVFIQKPFTLGTRDLANYERERVALDTCPVSETARECARLEDDLVFNGTENMPGLLSVPGSKSMNLLSWDEVGAAAKGIIEAITRLDDAGFHGPYSLALAPERYNLLFRLYPQGKQSELEHIKTMVTDGVFKTPILKSGGMLLATTAQCASIVLGQDMSIGYVGPAGAKQEFTISESLTVRIHQPMAICVLEE
ncbi:MAG: family 1 encapsulin nanocompartment shell protein [Anaerolineae bacterium]